MKDYSDITNLYSPFGDVMLTTRGTLVVGIELGGVDLSVFTESDLFTFNRIFRNILVTIPSNIIVTSYRISTDGAQIKYDKPDNPVAQLVVEARQSFLNKQNMSSTRTVLFFEIEPAPGFYSRPSVSSIVLDALSFMSKESRKRLKSSFSQRGSITLFEETLNDMYETLLDSVKSTQSRLQMIMETHILNNNDVWSITRFLATYNKSFLLSTPNPPLENWQNHLPDGDASVVTAKGMPCLLIRGVEDVFVRFGSVYSWLDQSVPPAGFFHGENAPLLNLNNSVYCTRFSPFSSYENNRLFSSRKDELTRYNLNIADMLTGRDDNEQQQIVRKSHQKAIDELDEASSLPEKWGNFTSTLTLFGDIARLRKDSPPVQSKFESAGAGLVWESRAIPFIFRQTMPTVPAVEVRKKPFTVSQYAACAAFSKDSLGFPHSDDLNKQHLFTFQTRSNEPFCYTPFLDGSVGTIGIGPIGTGKSFTKNTLATHWPKYGGFYRAIDVDPGTEPVARLYGEQGAIFSLDIEQERGLNPFVSANETNHPVVGAHIKELVVSMLSHNNASDANTLTAEEEINLSTCIRQVMAFGEGDPLRSFPGLVGMISQSLRDKLKDYYEGGIYEGLFYVQQDALGISDIPVGVFNLSNVKDIPVLHDLALKEIFFRNQLLFEDPRNRHLPKMLDIDEAHSLFKSKRETDKVVNYIRTGRKHMMGLSLWSQSPNEFINIPDWSALRSAAASFFFMADPAIDEEAYKRGFKLTTGEINTIQQLEPRKEMLIVQRRAGISKVVQLNVDKRQYALCTSKPLEAVEREQLIKELGVFEGTNAFIAKLEERAAV